MQNLQIGTNDFKFDTGVAQSLLHFSLMWIV